MRDGWIIHTELLTYKYYTSPGYVQQGHCKISSFGKKKKIYLVGRFSEELHNKEYHGIVLLSQKLSYNTI